MNAIAISLLVVVGSTVLALCGMFIVRRYLSHDELRPHHEVAGYLLGIVGTLYAVLLGLVVVDVQAKYQQARMMAESEANAAADLFHIAGGFPDKERRAIQQDLYNYVVIILEKEWNSPKGSTHEESTAPLRHLWSVLNNFEPTTNRDQQSYQQAIAEMVQLGDSRRFRITNSSGGVPPVLWIVLVAGGILTVMFTYFFGVASQKAHIIMISMLVLCLSLNVLLVVLYSNPYRGDLRVQPQGFMYDAQAFKELLK
jgi:Protein of unknown function (DUF4239)